jgi:hypothetical protein
MTKKISSADLIWWAHKLYLQYLTCVDMRLYDCLHRRGIDYFSVSSFVAFPESLKHERYVQSRVSFL